MYVCGEECQKRLTYRRMLFRWLLFEAGPCLKCTIRAQRAIGKLIGSGRFWTFSPLQVMS